MFALEAIVFPFFRKQLDRLHRLVWELEQNVWHFYSAQDLGQLGVSVCHLSVHPISPFECTRRNLSRRSKIEGHAARVKMQERGADLVSCFPQLGEQMILA